MQIDRKHGKEDPYRYHTLHLALSNRKVGYDLDDAIKLVRRAIEPVPASDPGYSEFQYSLVICLKARCTEKPDTENIIEMVETCERVLKFTRKIILTEQVA